MTNPTTTEETTMSTIDSYRAKWAKQDRQQELVNATYATYGRAMALRFAQVLATNEHAQYPQYDGMWDTGWELRVCDVAVTTKGGCRAKVGDIVMFRADRPGIGFTPSHTFYSVRGAIKVGVEYGFSKLAA